MKARSFSHTGVTVADFDTFVQFYADNFGCRLVGVGDSDPERVRTVFGVDHETPRCRIGWCCGGVARPDLETRAEATAQHDRPCRMREGVIG